MGRDGSHRPTTATRVASRISKHIDGTKDRFHAARCRATLTDAGLGQRPFTSSLTWRSAASGGALRSIFAAASKIGSSRPAPSRGLACRALSESESSPCLWCRSRAWLRQCRHGKQGNGDHAGRPWPVDRQAAGAPSPRCRPPATNNADRVAALARREAQGSTQTPRSRRMLALPNVVAEFATARIEVRHQSLADVAGKLAPLDRSRLAHRRLQAPRTRLSLSRS